MQKRSKATQARNARKRESGEPGGGQGRRDIVRGSKVYPISGPLPRGRAVIRTEAEWGQGERGAEGYYDHGDSGLEVGASTRARGRHYQRASAASRRRTTERKAEERDIPERQWAQFCNDFNRRHAGWYAEIEIHESGDQSEVEARRLPFEGITVDVKPGAKRTTTVILEMQQNVHLNHMVPLTRRIQFQESPSEPIFQITASNGDTTIVHFYAPPRNPKLLPAPKRSRRARTR